MCQDGTSQSFSVGLKQALWPRSVGLFLPKATHGRLHQHVWLDQGIVSKQSFNNRCYLHQLKGAETYYIWRSFCLTVGVWLKSSRFILMDQLSVWCLVVFFSGVVGLSVQLKTATLNMFSRLGNCVQQCLSSFQPFLPESTSRAGDPKSYKSQQLRGLFKGLLVISVVLH